MKKLLMLFVVMLAITACESKSEKLSHSDEFLNSTNKSNEESPRIKVIEGDSWHYFWILEVDGHLYLANANNGGIVHMESCPCKTK